MNYSNIYWIDTINGKGLRVSLFTSGCSIRCPGCFNKETWDFNNGSLFTEEIENSILDTIFNEKIEYSGLSILGGEPLDNMKDLERLLNKFKERNKQNNKNIWIWTGRTYDELINDKQKCDFLFKYCDIIVVGPFIENLKDLSLEFRGSKNQEIYKIDKTKNKFVLFDQ